MQTIRVNQRFLYFALRNFLFGFLSVSNGTNHSPPTLNGAPSPPQRFSNGPASSTSSALTNQQLPATCGARQLSKLKRFLTTLQQFGNDISPEIGEKVRTLVLALVVSTAHCPWLVTSVYGSEPKPAEKLYVFLLTPKPVSMWQNLQTRLVTSIICVKLLICEFQLCIKVFIKETNR